MNKFTTSLVETYTKEFERNIKTYKKVLLTKDSLAAYLKGNNLLSIQFRHGDKILLGYINHLDKSLIFQKPDDSKEYEFNSDGMLVEVKKLFDPNNFGPASEHGINLFLQSGEPITANLFVRLLREQTLAVYDKVYADYLAALEVVAMDEAVKEAKQDGQ